MNTFASLDPFTADPVEGLPVEERPTLFRECHPIQPCLR